MGNNLRARATMINIGRRVRAFRVSAGLSQRELARRARMTGKFVGQIERGASNPSVASLALVADALGCEVADLIQDQKSVPAVAIGREDARRAREALSVLGALLTPRRSGTRRTARSATIT
jgi:transcriptional regulator with XRE-family HTH domain